MADGPEEVALVGDRAGSVGGDLLIPSDPVASCRDASHRGDVEVRREIGARRLGGFGDPVETRHTFFEHPVERCLIELGDRFEAPGGFGRGVDPTADPLTCRAAAVAERDLSSDGTANRLYLDPAQPSDSALGRTQHLLQLIRCQGLEVDRSIHDAVSLTPMTRKPRSIGSRQRCRGPNVSYYPSTSGLGAFTNTPPSSEISAILHAGGQNDPFGPHVSSSIDPEAFFETEPALTVTSTAVSPDASSLMGKPSLVCVGSAETFEVVHSPSVHTSSVKESDPTHAAICERSSRSTSPHPA